MLQSRGKVGINLSTPGLFALDLQSVGTDIDLARAGAIRRAGMMSVGGKASLPGPRQRVRGRFVEGCTVCCGKLAEVMKALGARA